MNYINRFIGIFVISLLIISLRVTATSAQSFIIDMKRDSMLHKSTVQDKHFEKVEQNQTYNIKKLFREDVLKKSMILPYPKLTAQTWHEHSEEAYWDTLSQKYIFMTRYYYAYDQNDNQKGYLLQGYNNGNWINDYRMLSNYDINNHVLDETEQLWTGSTWQNFTLIKYNYDNSGKLKQKTAQYWLDSLWVNDSQLINTYDSVGNVKEELYLFWNGVQWQNDGKIEYEYDASGKRITQTALDWFFQVWVNYSKSLFKYDPEGHLIKETDQDWNGSSWINSYLFEYKFGSNNEWSEWTLSTWYSTEWGLYYHILFNYDSVNRRTKLNGQYWDAANTKWINDYRYLLTYDSNDNAIEVSEQNWNKDIWVNYFRTQNFYTSTRPGELPTPIERNNIEIPIHASLYQNYPNPFNPATQIRYDLNTPGLVHLDIYDVTGKIVARLINSFQASGSHFITFRANNLSSGVYFYRLQEGNNIITKKMLLIK
ncbi:MAG TPA: T9SS type A sorting domain-containing protein [Balneolales bacterium]|nr:T9SS type A sorting domain-containing protein [Balneolales bacterium]